MGSGRFDFQDVKKLKKQLEQLERERNKFCEDCAKELAARLFAALKRNTPVDKGTLRHGWTVSQGFGVRVEGDRYIVELTNPTEYGSYVNSGHRTASHRGWVPGQFFVEKSEKEISSIEAQLLEKRLNDWLKGVFSD